MGAPPARVPGLVAAGVQHRRTGRGLVWRRLGFFFLPSSLPLFRESFCWFRQGPWLAAPLASRWADSSSLARICSPLHGSALPRPDRGSWAVSWRALQGSSAGGSRGPGVGGSNTPHPYLASSARVGAGAGQRWCSPAFTGVGGGGPFRGAFGPGGVGNGCGSGASDLASLVGAGASLLDPAC